MQHTTIYYHGKKHGWTSYTTKAHTPHHAFLRDKHQGRTWEHDGKTSFFFILGIPLVEPIGKDFAEVDARGTEQRGAV